MTKLLLLLVAVCCIFASVWGMYSYVPYTVNGCADEDLTIQCEHEQMINIVSAFHGRRDTKTCDGGSNIRCSNPNALSVVRARCQSQNSCTMKVNGRTFKGNPCPEGSAYVEVMYKCT